MYCTLKSLFLSILAALALTACSDPLPPDRKVEHVRRVFMHDPEQYSVMVVGDTAEMKLLYLGRCSAKFVTDVPKDSDMWLFMHWTPPSSTSGINSCDVVFHIHATEDVNGAGWNHGKFGSGMTNVVP